MPSHAHGRGEETMTFGGATRFHQVLNSLKVDEGRWPYIDRPVVAHQMASAPAIIGKSYGMIALAQARVSADKSTYANCQQGDAEPLTSFGTHLGRYELTEIRRP